MSIQPNGSSASNNASQGHYQLLSLPPELLSNVLHKAASQSDENPTILFELAKTCTLLKAELKSPAYWELAWTHYRLSERGSVQEAPPPGTSPCEALRLYSAAGCMLCGWPWQLSCKFRAEVYWPFHRRLCAECLHSQTVLHCDLQERYGLTIDLFERLPNWEDRTGSRKVWQYWREDIVQIVQEVYGLPSLNALVMQRRMQAAERQRAAEERKREAAEKKRLVQKEGVERLAAALASFDPELRAAPAELQASETFQQQLAAVLADDSGLGVLPGADALARVCMEVRKHQAKQQAQQQEQQEQEQQRLQRQQQRLQRQQLHQLGHGRTLPCEICGFSRPFTFVGLYDHTRNVHGKAAVAALAQRLIQGHVQAPGASAAAAAALGRQEAATAAQAAAAGPSAADPASAATPLVHTGAIGHSSGRYSGMFGTNSSSSAAPAAAAVQSEPVIDLTAASSMAPTAAAGPAIPSLPIDLTAFSAQPASARL